MTERVEVVTFTLPGGTKVTASPALARRMGWTPPKPQPDPEPAPRKRTPKK